MRHIPFLALLALLACKPKVAPDQKPVEEALAAYQENPTDSVAQVLSSAVSRYVESKGMQDSTAARYVIAAARARAAHKNLDDALRHYRTWLTAYPARPDAAKMAEEAIRFAAPLAGPEAMQCAYSAYLQRFPETAAAAEWKPLLKDSGAGTDSLLGAMRHAMFNEETFRLDDTRAADLLVATELAVMIDPMLPSAPEDLHLAAETARTIRRPEKAVEFFDWLVQYYPEHPRGVTALFLKGFVIDNDLKDFTRAGEVYKEFLARHPNHEFAESAQFMLDNLGKSDDELLRELEAKQKGKEQ